jgi:2-polyprenyl-6-methoxyphenol hydroxylase-like FAD-dependent oxidoreductase
VLADAEHTAVVIAGGGPTGLALAAELGRWGVPCVLLEEKPSTSVHPQANANSARTMEHYRRLGFAHEVRAAGLPAEYPTDVAYFTTFADYELARHRQPSRAEAQAVSTERRYVGSWFTPELPHRASQLFVEPILARRAGSWPSVSLRFGHRVMSFAEGPTSVTVNAEEVSTGRPVQLSCEFLVGCDGPRSIVRRGMGTSYTGGAHAEREFLGGQMFAVYFRAPAFYDRIPHERAWQYWSMSPGRRAVVVAIDGRGSFAGSVQLPPDGTPSPEEALASLAMAFGVDIPVEAISSSTWTSGYALVAEEFVRSRVTLAGDAAHLFTPTGGMGYNTGIEDVANLGWKLAALHQGWGGPALLGSYATERRPVALRNTAFAHEIGESIGRFRQVPDVDADTVEGRRVRAEIGTELERHAQTEFDIPGIQLGTRYENSPVIVSDGSDASPDLANVYIPSARPGSRLPHLWLKGGESLFDRLGQGFTALYTRSGAIESDALVEAARLRGLPLHVLDISEEDAREVFGADVVLIRPDQHVAWRGNSWPASPGALLDRASGR